MSAGKSQDQTLDYQHFIDYQLTRAQGRMKSVEIGTAVVRLITAVLAYLVLVVGLDHAVILSGAVRLAMLLVALAAGAAYFGVAVVLPNWRRISHLYTARTIEQATPEFKNSLINFLDLRRRPKELPAGVMALLEERAVADLSGVQVEEKINHERLVRASYGLAVAVFVTCVAVLINARSLADSLGRVLFPTANIQPPTKTRLTEIKPGDKTVVALTPVTVSAIADGKEPAQVSLFWSDDGGRFWREQPLKKAESGSQFDPWTTQLVVEKPVQYYLVGGDCRTKEFTIDVTQPPMVTELELLYDYPEYTGWAKYSSHNGNIDALEGTIITLTATANRPISTGQIRFGSNKSLGPAMLPVANRSDQLTAQFAVTKNDSYVIWFVTADNETNPRPTSYEIKVRSDLPPTVTVKPGTDQVDPPVPANAIVPIGVTARDDFGIDEVKLSIGRGQETIYSIDLTDLQSPGKEFNTTHRMDLEKLRLNNGDEISYWVDVADNRQPKRNRVASPHYRIRLGSPLSPTERQDEEKRQVQLAKAEDADKAARAAEKTADESAEQPDNTARDKADQATPAAEPTPKDERALDVIRQYMQEKAREPQSEQPRDSQSDSEKQGADASGQGEQSDSKDPDNASKKDGKDAGKDKADGKSAASESDAGEKSDRDGADTRNSKDNAGSSKQGNQKTAADKTGNDKSKGQSSGDQGADPEKPSADKSDAKSDGEPKSSAGSENSKGSEQRGDKSGMNQGDENSRADPSSREKPGDSKSGGEKIKNAKSGDSGTKGDEQSKQERVADEQARGDKSGQDKTGSDGTRGEKPAGDKNSGEQSGEQAVKKDGAGSGAEKTGEKPGDSAPGSGKPSEKNSGTKSEGSEAGEKSDAETKKSDRGAPKGNGTDQQGKPSSGAKPQDAKSQSNKQGAGQSGGNKTGTKQSDQGNPGGEPQGGENSSGAKPGGGKGDEKAGDGEKAGSGGKASDKQSERGTDDKDSSTDEKADGKKADGDKSGGADSEAGQPGGDKQPGEKQAGSSGGSKGDAKGAAGKSNDAAQAPGQTAPAGQGAGSSGGGNNSSGQRTENAQPGGGPNPGQGPIRKNDSSPRESPATRSTPIPDYSNEGSELVLERLAKQLDKGEVDPKLLERLGWTRDELEQFVKEFHGPGATDANQPDTSGKTAKTKKPAASGKTTLNEKHVRSTRRGPGETAVDTVGENYEGRRSKPAPEYDDFVRAYNMSQSKSEPPASANPSGK